MNNKGSSIADLLFIIIILFTLAVGSIFLYKIFDSTSEGIAQIDSIDQDIRDGITEQKNTFPKVFDNIFLIIVVGLGISLFIGAFFLNSHPVFFIFAVILLIIAVIISAIIANTYEEIAANTTIASAESQFTIIPYVFNNFTMIIAGLGVLLLVGLFAKSRSDPI